MPKKAAVNFEVSISGRDDGTVEAIYVKFLPDAVAKTVEVEQDELLVDYNENGDVVGIEILAPVKLAQLTDLVEQGQRDSFLRFIRTTVPDSFVKMI
jgi:uncharacterized protein YuzE